MGIIPIVTYATVAVFIIAVVARYFKFANMPLHLRWELYPVAHEKGRAHYGGSYLEEPDWWTKPRESSMIGELKVMLPEIIFLAGVWEHNKKQWFRSFPFHFGLYLLVGMIGLLMIGAIAAVAGADISAEAGFIGKAIHHLTYIFGYVGLVLAFIGSVALLTRRLNDLDYREYTKKSDFFNLYFFIITLGIALIAHITGDTYFAGLRGYFQNVFTFNFTADVTVLQGAEIVLASLLAAYIPLTHMSHFFTKWFMYHHIRWSDEPNLKGGHFEAKIHKSLMFPVSWSGPHIRGDGKKNWVDVATSSPKPAPEKEEEK